MLSSQGLRQRGRNAGNLSGWSNVQLSAMEDIHRDARLLSRIILAALLFLPLQVLVAEQVSQLPKPADYVNDFAHVLTPESVAKLDRVCSELDHSQANAQVAVVTVHNLDGDDAADWATSWKTSGTWVGKGQTGACWFCWRWTITNTALMWATGSKGS